MWQFQCNVGNVYLCNDCYFELQSQYGTLRGWEWIDHANFNEYCCHCDTQVGEIQQRAKETGNDRLD